MTLRSSSISSLAFLIACGLLSACATMTVTRRAQGSYFIRPRTETPLSPNPFFYALVPLTVPFDIVTAPLQLIIFTTQDLAP